MAKRKPLRSPALPPDLPGAGRYQSVDILRGVAIALMLAFHFCFDLAYFGALRIDIYRDPFWVHSRSVIVTLFLLTMGMSLHLATARGIVWPRFLRRLGFIAGGAAAVSVGSYLVFPNSWIFFGVLHFIALASVLGLAFRGRRWVNLGFGSALVALGVWFAHPFFNQGPWQWLGLMTHKPITEDYVPLLPWFGVVLVGMFLGQTLFGRERPAAWLARERRHGLARWLATTGRHSLLIYLVHQPVLFGALYLVFG